MRPDKKEKNQYVKRKNYFRSWNAECKTIEKYEKQEAVVRALLSYTRPTS